MKLDMEYHLVFYHTSLINVQHHRLHLPSIACCQYPSVINYPLVSVLHVSCGHNNYSHRNTHGRDSIKSVTACLLYVSTFRVSVLSFCLEAVHKII